MARVVKLFGAASLLIVDDEHEIEALIGHPALTRDFEERGPFVNQVIVSRLLRDFKVNGKIIRSMRPKDDSERSIGQTVLRSHLDDIANSRGWDPQAVEAAADYVRSGQEKNRALAALTYASAFPFLGANGRDGEAVYDESDFTRAYRHYYKLSQARRPFSLRGAVVANTGGIGRAQRALLKFVGDDDYGLHALSVTLDNSVKVLEQMREAYVEAENTRQQFVPFRWNMLRTAPRSVLRQLKSDCTLPFAEERLPAYTLVVFRMRDSVKSDTYSGFEFAARQWSACPAHRYLVTYFADVWGTAHYGADWILDMADMQARTAQPWERGDLI